MICLKTKTIRITNNELLIINTMGIAKSISFRILSFPTDKNEEQIKRSIYRGEKLIKQYAKDACEKQRKIDDKKAKDLLQQLTKNYLVKEVCLNAPEPKLL